MPLVRSILGRLLSPPQQRRRQGQLGAALPELLQVRPLPLLPASVLQVFPQTAGASGLPVSAVCLHGLYVPQSRWCWPRLQYLHAH